MAATQSIDVVLADDAEHFRRGLAAVLAGEWDLRVVGEAADGAGAIDLVERLAPDVAVVDLRMPGVDGVAATRRIREVSPITRVLILTVSDEDDDLLDAILAGAHGYLLKDAAIEAVPEAIRSLVHGGAAISPAMATGLMAECSSLMGRSPSGRSSMAGDADVVLHVSSPGPRLGAPLREDEVRVLNLLAEGATTPEIADELAMSRVVVAHQVRNVLERVHLNTWLREHGFEARPAESDA